MTIFLPAADAGRLSVGDEARIILDPVPDYVIPAKVSFVAADAQFTPKTVETTDERAKLMFRVKLKSMRRFFKQFYTRVKTGVRGWASCAPRPMSSGRRASGQAAQAPAARRRTAQRRRRKSLTATRRKPRRPTQNDRRAVARVKNVSHRYGATVSLADVTIDIPSRIMVGVIGPDGVGKSTLLGLIAGVKQHSERRGRRLRQEHRRPGDLARDSRPHRLYAAGPRPQSLSDALACSRTSISSADCSDCRRRSVAPRSTELLTATSLEKFEARPAGKLSGGMKQKLSLCCALINDPGPSHPRRADDRRRPAVARPVLGPHQHDPRAPAADERHGRHRLHGRSGALRLADGDGRRQDHRHRHAEGAARQDGRAQSRRRLHRHDARGQARPAQEGGRASARRLAGRDAGDRGRGADAPVRRFRRGRPRQLQDCAAARSSASSARTAAANRRR